MLDLTSLARALSTLDRGLARWSKTPKDEELRDACIQRFEFTFELRSSGDSILNSLGPGELREEISILSPDCRLPIALYCPRIAAGQPVRDCIHNNALDAQYAAR